MNDNIESVPTEAVPVPVVPANRFQRFSLNHPRTAQVVGFAALAAATIGALKVWKSRKEIVEKTADQMEDVADNVRDIV